MDDTAAVENEWISETENPLQNKTTEKLQNFCSTDLIRGGCNNTVAVCKISYPVIDMTQYSFEGQLDGKRRKIEFMGIMYYCTGPGKIKGWPTSGLVDKQGQELVELKLQVLVEVRMSSG
jgi:hypothetical protein